MLPVNRPVWWLWCPDRPVTFGLAWPAKVWTAQPRHSVADHGLTQDLRTVTRPLPNDLPPDPAPSESCASTTCAQRRRRTRTCPRRQRCRRGHDRGGGAGEARGLPSLPGRMDDGRVALTHEWVYGVTRPVPVSTPTAPAMREAKATSRRPKMLTVRLPDSVLAPAMLTQTVTGPRNRSTTSGAGST